MTASRCCCVGVWVCGREKQILIENVAPGASEMSTLGYTLIWEFWVGTNVCGSACGGVTFLVLYNGLLVFARRSLLIPAGERRGNLQHHMRGNDGRRERSDATRQALLRRASPRASNTPRAGVSHLVTPNVITPQSVNI